MDNSTAIYKLRPAKRGNFYLPLLLVIFLAILPAGCSFFSGTSSDPKNGEDGVETVDEKIEKVKEDPFAEGTLKAIAHLAPPNSPAQYLSIVAEQLGWEDQVAENTLLRIEVEDDDFEDRVEPHLLSLFFKMGFSILPIVGEGHQFSRDSIIRGGVKDTKFLVTTRELVRLIFLVPMKNIQIIYPQDGTQPQIFAPNPEGIVVVRRSLLEQYLR